MTAYDPAAGDIGICEHCHRPIRHGQPYETRIPFRGSWGGFVHRICPPQLVVATTTTGVDS